MNSTKARTRRRVAAELAEEHMNLYDLLEQASQWAATHVVGDDMPRMSSALANAVDAVNARIVMLEDELFGKDAG